jgi:cobalt-zinc-cadmium efflux system protein
MALKDFGMSRDHTHPHHDHHGQDHAGHSHAPADFGRAFAIGVALNATIVVLQAVYGVMANSLALLADAGHNLSDVVGLLLAWGAASLGKRSPTAAFTYGFGRTTILAALANAMLLLGATGAIAWEAARRFAEPQPVHGVTVVVVAVIGIAINGATALMFMRGRAGDINIRGAFLHMVSDAVVSAGVVVAALVILFTGWQWVDPAMSLAIVVVIALGTWGLLKQSVGMVVDAVPEGIDPDRVAEHLRALGGVTAVHDLHIWPLSTTSTALTAHLVLATDRLDDDFTAAVAQELKTRFRIDHVTLQYETGKGAPCALEPAHVI